MDEHDLRGGRFGGMSAPEWRAKDFFGPRLVGSSGEAVTLPDDYWATRMEEYRRRLTSLADDLATLGDTSDTSSTSSS